jgi:hypothetical protein
MLNPLARLLAPTRLVLDVGVYRPLTPPSVMVKYDIFPVHTPDRTGNLSSQVLSSFIKGGGSPCENPKP